MKWLSIVWLAAIVFAGSLGASKAEQSETFETFLTGGVLRNNGDGWEPIFDGSHRPLNILGTRTTRRYIEIRQKGGDFTVSAIVTVDNNLAAEGYTVGLSGGRDVVRLVIFKDGAVVDPRTINTESIPLSNLWFLTVQGVAALPLETEPMAQIDSLEDERTEFDQN